MANTFLEMTRALRLHVPQLDEFLAQQFVRDRYRIILERRDWSGLRAEGEFLLDAAKTTGTVAVTNNSLSVIGTGTAFASTDVGRQFKAGAGSPVYTIATYVSPTSVTLDRVWGGTTQATATFFIFDGYLTAPADFKRFIVVVDPKTGYRLRHWVSQDELLRVDPQRNFFGTPYALIDRRFNASGRVQYEAWPYSASQRSLPHFYVKQGEDLVDDDDVPIWPIRSDVIVTGALADVCRWPGTKDNPNLTFGKMDIYESYRKEFEDKLVDLERQDENIYATWLTGQDWASWPWAPWSANWMQSHAF